MQLCNPIPASCFHLGLPPACYWLDSCAHIYIWDSWVQRRRVPPDMGLLHVCDVTLTHIGRRPHGLLLQGDLMTPSAVGRPSGAWPLKMGRAQPHPHIFQSGLGYFQPHGVGAYVLKESESPTLFSYPRHSLPHLHKWETQVMQSAWQMGEGLAVSVFFRNVVDWRDMGQAKTHLVNQQAGAYFLQLSWHVGKNHKQKERLANSPPIMCKEANRNSKHGWGFSY